MSAANKIRQGLVDAHKVATKTANDMLTAAENMKLCGRPGWEATGTNAMLWQQTAAIYFAAISAHDQRELHHQQMILEFRS